MLKLIENINIACNEDIEIHDKLNEKIWSEDNSLLPEVKRAIKNIVTVFVDELHEKEIPLVVKDVYIVGSNANYNYTDESDLDIHIIADSSEDCNKKHLKKMYELYKNLFNMKYDIKIKDIDVEVYIELDSDSSRKSSGVYSIDNGWIKEPSRFEIPEIDKAKLEKEIAKWESKYLDLIENDLSIESINKYINDLYDMRLSDIADSGEFSIGNLVFKEIRKLGYLEDLKNKRINLENNELSLS